MSFDPMWLRKQVKEFVRQQEAYILYAQVLERLLKEACRQLGVDAMVSSRPKSVGSFTEKAIRRLAEYNEPAYQLTDLCGARVVTYTEADARLVHAHIRRSFCIDEADIEDAGKRLKTDQFGYRAMHFVVQMPWVEVMGMSAFDRLARRLLPAFKDRLPGILARPGGHEADSVFGSVFGHAFKNGEPNLYDELLKLRNRSGHGQTAGEVAEEEMKLLRRVLEAGPKSGPRGGLPQAARIIGTIGNRKAEIQVCTVLQHVWSFIGHDRLYKAEFRPPPQIVRQLHRVSALLEQADEEFSRGVRELDEYRLDYGAYMTLKKRCEEIAKWQEAGKVSGELSVALRIAGLAASLGDHKAVIEVLQPHRDQANPDVLTRLGQALSRRQGAGRAELKRATRLAPDSAVAWCYLGDTYCEHSGCCAVRDRRPKRRRCDDAARCYGNAYNAEPDNPTALSRYIQCKLCAGANPKYLALLKPGLEAARNKARRRAEVGVHLPDALYDIGLFELLLGRPYDSLGAYAKAVFVSDSVEPVRNALESITRMRKLKAGGDAPDLMRHAGWVQRFLQVAVVAKTYQLERRAAGRLAERRRQLAVAEHGLKKAENGLAEHNGNPPEAANIKLANQTLAETEQKCEDLRKDCTEAEALLVKGRSDSKAALKAFRALKLQTRLQAGGWEVTDPVTIVVGGCDAGTEQFMKSYRDLLLKAFTDCHGIVFSAGTTAGIGGLVGEIQKKHPHLHTVGYLPRQMPEWAERDERYKRIRHTSGEDDFSALEPLQNWVDIIQSGIRPEEVRLLGINGGRIAAFEYRMALAFDAWVAVLDKSGREAARLLPDEKWGKAERLMVLPAEANIVREYLRRPEPLPEELQKLREPLGADIHEDVREEKLKAPTEPSMFDWYQLPGVFKESSRRQADHIFVKLQHIGYGWRKAPEESEFEIHQFDEETVEELSELEHARFVIERFRDGWKYDTVKDMEKKTNPTLVGWRELSEKTKDYDRVTVRKIPAYLAKHNIALVCEKPSLPRTASRKKKGTE